MPLRRQSTTRAQYWNAEFNELAEIEQVMRRYDAMNPFVIRDMQRQAQVAFDAATRWTDNISILRSWTVKHFSSESMNPLITRSKERFPHDTS